MVLSACEFRADMFRTDAIADDAGGNSAEKRNRGEQPCSKWSVDRPLIAQYTRNNPLLHDDLQPLRYSGGQLPSPLDLAQMVTGDLPLAQRIQQNIGCRHRVLNREIDADAADRRHRVRRVSDA